MLSNKEIVRETQNIQLWYSNFSIIPFSIIIDDVSSIILNVHFMIFHALYPCLHYNAENAERTKRNTKHVSARQEKMYVHYVRSFK